ncbi:MAG: hypothetical protein J7K47_03955 [Thermoplasmata archaeon]|nr:hypothetical protein [Thermoplasmata archaeon]
MKILVTGKKDSGKSTFLYNVCKKCKCSGAICLPVFENGIKIGSDVINLLNGKREVFARVKEKALFSGITTDRYVINQEGMNHAIKAIEEGIRSDTILIIDEVGSLEMRGKGYYKILEKAIQHNNVVMVVRKSILKKFLKKFPGNYFILELRH